MQYEINGLVLRVGHAMAMVQAGGPEQAHAPAHEVTDGAQFLYGLVDVGHGSGLGLACVFGTKGLTNLGVGFQIWAFDEVDAIRYRGKYGVQTIGDG